MVLLLFSPYRLHLPFNALPFFFFFCIFGYTCWNFQRQYTFLHFSACLSIFVTNFASFATPVDTTVLSCYQLKLTNISKKFSCSFRKLLCFLNMEETSIVIRTDVSGQIAVLIVLRQAVGNSSNV